jgi:hypothetical protein
MSRKNCWLFPNKNYGDFWLTILSLSYRKKDVVYWLLFGSRTFCLLVTGRPRIIELRLLLFWYNLMTEGLVKCTFFTSRSCVRPSVTAPRVVFCSLSLLNIIYIFLNFSRSSSQEYRSRAGEISRISLLFFPRFFPRPFSALFIISRVPWREFPLMKSFHLG